MPIFGGGPFSRSAIEDLANAKTFWTALGTSTLAALVTCLGVYTIRRFSDWGQRNTTYFMCFAAGVLIAASFLHIIPKSIHCWTQA